MVGLGVGGLDGIMTLRTRYPPRIRTDDDIMMTIKSTNKSCHVGAHGHYKDGAF